MPSSKAKSAPVGFVIVAALLLIFGVYSLRKWSVESSEMGGRPWAYSSDPAAKLLVGIWQGEFKDPAGVGKKIELEIFVPLTEEELQGKITRRHRSRVRSQDRRSFDGVASIQSPLGAEVYEIYGSVEESDFHRFELHFAQQEGAKRVLPNYTARIMTEGEWTGDSLKAQLAFTHYDAEGSSHTTSEGVVENGKLVWKENADEKPVSVVLNRKGK